MRKKVFRRGGNKAVAYGRYSSTKQQMQSIEGQFNECEKFADREGYKIVEYYSDEAKTGREMAHRYGLHNMLDYLAENPDVGYVIIYKMDRLSRDDRDRIEILGRLADLGVVVLKTAELNGTGAAGYLSDSLNSMLAVHYSLELSEKTARGMAQSAKNGTSTGTTPPYGYKWEKKKLIVDDTQAPVAGLIFSRYAEGASKKQIAEELNRLGYTNKKGKPWSFKDFENMLKNRKYIGEWWYKGELANPHGNEPIIDIDTFNKVQEMLAVNKQQAGGKQRQKREYACSGKIYCMRCGSPMIAIGGTGRGEKQYYYYACKNARCKECEKTNERQDIIDSWVVGEITSTFGITYDNIHNVAVDIAKLYQQRSATGNDSLDVKKQNLKKAEQESEKLLQLMLQVSDSELLVAKFAETNERIKALKSDIATLECKQNKLPHVQEIKQWLEGIVEQGIGATDSVRELIDTCIARIYVDNDERGIIIWQMGNRLIDEDTIGAIIERQKNSIYTEPCIDAIKPGSPDWT